MGCAGDTLLYLDGVWPGGCAAGIGAAVPEVGRYAGILYRLRAVVGLTADAADYLYLGDPWWHPAAEPSILLTRTIASGGKKVLPTGDL